MDFELDGNCKLRLSLQKYTMHLITVPYSIIHFCLQKIRINKKDRGLNKTRAGLKKITKIL
jgi:hypothetical protein